MQELTKNEIEQVNGGIIPVIGFAAAVASHTMARTMGSWVVSRVGMIAGAYGFTEWLSN